MSPLMDIRFYVIAGLAIFLIIRCTVALITGKIHGPWWTAENFHQMLWPGGKIYKKNENPRKFWFLVIFYYLSGFLILYILYWILINFN